MGATDQNWYFKKVREKTFLYWKVRQGQVCGDEDDVLPNGPCR